MKKVVSLVILFALILCCSACGKQKDPFPDWVENAPGLATLKAYVEAVTDEGSPDFIPEEDRIAVFDMDGTLYGEKANIYFDWMLLAYRALDDPDYDAPEDVKEVAQRVRTAGETGVIPSELESQEPEAAARAFAGMTVAEYCDYARKLTEGKVRGFDGLLYRDAWYKPMLEIVDYLNDNGFICYLCSGSDRFLCRVLAEGHLNIPPDRIIGTDVFLEASGQDGKDGLDYRYDEEDEVVRSDTVIVKNIKANKVVQILQEIGRQPVLSFGNSSGDTSMAMFVSSNNPYKSEVFMVIADDDVRENGDPEKAKALREEWEAFGWNVFSMKDDFKTIYGEGVTRSPS